MWLDSHRSNICRKGTFPSNVFNTEADYRPGFRRTVGDTFSFVEVKMVFYLSLSSALTYTSLDNGDCLSRIKEGATAKGGY